MTDVPFFIQAIGRKANDHMATAESRSYFASVFDILSWLECRCPHRVRFENDDDVVLYVQKMLEAAMLMPPHLLRRYMPNVLPREDTLVFLIQECGVTAVPYEDRNAFKSLCILQFLDRDGDTRRLVADLRDRQADNAAWLFGALFLAGEDDRFADDYVDILEEIMRRWDDQPELYKCWLSWSYKRLERGRRRIEVYFNLHGNHFVSSFKHFTNSLCNGCNCWAVVVKACGNCNSVSYCSKACQKSHWKRHKRVCSG